ncbi:hypothetical protein [Streptomyces litchfieldiae]|uniref:Secreted protein n=1 Tax=Streptomyces litchfieldiae TaxID=3075543 RepID=A0ABU2N1H4_9ACTN|nr:hypothetical protein [Streptomyces sp. DSM 44938]MDT0347734.1 hypothetical protein [Streptomyces sp. DSM 44938]
MDVLALVTAVVALAGAAVTAVLGYWAQRRLRTLDQRNLMEAYGAALAWAAYDLQSRLFNILRGHAIEQTPGKGHGFLTGFLTEGTAEDGEYARRSTVFLLAEYLGWVEILRRDVQFLDLGRSRTNQQVMGKISEIGSILNRTPSGGPEPLRVFRTQQRAIGELMVHPEGEPGRRRCLGYAEFCAKLDTDDNFRRWFRQLLADIDSLAEHPGPSLPRLEEIQHRLIGLIDLLDPKSEQFPQSRRPFGQHAG